MTFKELNPIYSEDYDGMTDDMELVLMGYFRELPNIAYQSPLSHKNSSLDYVLNKKFFQTYKTFDFRK